MKKIKLPRKRKKAFIKAKGKYCYYSIVWSKEATRDWGVAHNVERFYIYDQTTVGLTYPRIIGKW